MIIINNWCIITSRLPIYYVQYSNFSCFFFLEKVDFEYPSLVDIPNETHGGDDVMVFARGPMSHLFTGNYEQNLIALGMAMAADISTSPPTSDSASGAIASFNVAGQTILAVLLLVFVGVIQSNL